MPYYQHLVNEMKAAWEKYDKVVLTFAIMGLFDGEIDFLLENFPNIKFVAINCDTDILVERFF